MTTVALVASMIVAGPAWAVPSPAFAQDAAGGKPGDPPPVRVGGDIKPPVKVKDLKPVYPVLAKQTKVQGVVIIEATIGTDGKVQNTKVLRSVRLLDEAAVTAVKGQEYKPTIVNGKAVPVIMTVPINFVMD